MNPAQIEKVRPGVDAVVAAGETIGHIRHEGGRWHARTETGDVIIEQEWLGDHKTRVAALAAIEGAWQAWLAVPDRPPVTSGDWGIDSKGRLFFMGEWIGYMRHDPDQDRDDRHGRRRAFYGQGLKVGDYAADYTIGGSSARSITLDEHAAHKAEPADA